MSPEKEKSSPGTRATGKEKASGSPSRASRSTSAPPGYAEPEQARTLVEGLPGRVVERPAEHLEPRAVGDGEDERVPAAREEARERRLERLRLEVERRDVRAEVVDGDEVETS